MEDAVAIAALLVGLATLIGNSAKLLLAIEALADGIDRRRRRSGQGRTKVSNPKAMTDDKLGADRRRRLTRFPPFSRVDS